MRCSSCGGKCGGRKSFTGTEQYSQRPSAQPKTVGTSQKYAGTIHTCLPAPEGDTHVIGSHKMIHALVWI